jgi:hypothetical protein
MGEVLRSLALVGWHFRSCDELRQAVEVATTYWNVHKHPFSWGRRHRHQPRRQPVVAAAISRSAHSVSFTAQVLRF